MDTGDRACGAEGCCAPCNYRLSHWREEDGVRIFCTVLRCTPHLRVLPTADEMKYERPLQALPGGKAT